MAGETLHSLAHRHDLARNLICIWIQKFKAGALDHEAIAADTIEGYEARIAALERLVGKQALEEPEVPAALDDRHVSKPKRKFSSWIRANTLRTWFAVP
jgi:transposase